MTQQFTSAEQADKWAFISNKADGHYARARFNGLKNERNLVIIVEENEERPGQTREVIFEVRANGSAYAVTRQELAERETAEQPVEKLAWTLQNGNAVKVWTFKNAFYVSINGGKRAFARMEAVPASQAKVAKENGIVAVLAMSNASVALTAERKEAIEL